MIWYPYVQMKTMPPAIEIVSGEGPYLITRDGTRVLDSISSWWSVIHGYQHPQMLEAIHSQLDQLSHVMLGGLTHEPAQRLANKLKSWLPGDLDYCFFSDSGSVAVEVALKMAQQYFSNRGAPRSDILALKHSYHGDTFKAMAVGDDADYHQAFPDRTGIWHIDTTIEALEQAFAQKSDYAAMIVEPLLQGAGGMRMYELDFLERARELCDKHGVLLIFDEVATGFGRTGYRFVADQVLPDILVLGKALTGGMLGHAVTVANEKVWQAFYQDDPQKALMHGPTFMANPLACAAALRSIELFESGQYMEHIQAMAKTAHQLLDGFSHPEIKEIRILGGCVAIEVHAAASLKGYHPFAWARGIFSRPFGTCLYSMPAYTLSDQEWSSIIECMREWFEQK